MEVKIVKFSKAFWFVPHWKALKKERNKEFEIIFNNVERDASEFSSNDDFIRKFKRSHPWYRSLLSDDLEN